MLELEVTLDLLGASAVALWIETRWPAIRPGLSFKLFLHVALTCLLVYVKTAHFTVLLAILIYMILVWIWTVRALVDCFNNGGGGLSDRV